MKRLLKSKRLWLALAAIVLLAIATFTFWPKPPPQIITLPDGTQYEFAGATYGTNLVPPSLLCHIAAHLPALLHGLAVKILGSRVTWDAAPPLGGSPATQPVLAVWFWRRQTNGFSTKFLIPPVLLADQNDFTVNENGGPGIFFSVSRSKGWFCQEFSVVPKRSPTLQFLMVINSDRVERVTFRNPIYGNFPQWTPKDALPFSNNFTDLRVRIENWKSDDYQPSRRDKVVLHSLSTTVRREPSTEWTISDAELSDVTGNILNRSFGTAVAMPSYVRSQPVEIVSFSSVLWPGENAWRLKLQLTNSSGAGHTIDLYVKPPTP